MGKHDSDRASSLRKIGQRPSRPLRKIGQRPSRPPGDAAKVSSSFRIDAAHPAPQPSRAVASLVSHSVSTSELAATRGLPPAGNAQVDTSQISVAPQSTDTGPSTADPSTADPTSQPTQAEQLRFHLLAWQAELERREARLHSESSQLGDDSHTAQRHVDKRAEELDARSRQLDKAARQLEHRRADFEEAEARFESQRAELESQRRKLREAQEHLALERDELISQAATIRSARQETVQREKIERSEGERHRHKMISQAAAILEYRNRHLAKAEARVASHQVAVNRREQELVEAQRDFQQRSDRQRRQAAIEIREAEEALQKQRDAIARETRELDQTRAALERLRKEATDTQRETLKTRLAMEKLWLQLAATNHPEAVHQSIRQVRKQLDEHYREAEARLQAQKQELEALRSQVTRQSEDMLRQKDEFDRRSAEREREAKEEATRLTAWEEALARRETQMLSARHR